MEFSLSFLVDSTDARDSSSTVSLPNVYDRLRCVYTEAITASQLYKIGENSKKLIFKFENCSVDKLASVGLPVCWCQSATGMRRTGCVKRLFPQTDRNRLESDHQIDQQMLDLYGRHSQQQPFLL